MFGLLLSFLLGCSDSEIKNDTSLSQNVEDIEAGCASVIGATILAFGGKEGWGWFLLVAILCSTTFETTN